MKLKLVISALAACTLMSGTALADGPKKPKKHEQKHEQTTNESSARGVAAGGAAAGPNGAVAVGGAASETMQRTTRRGDRRGMVSSRCAPGTTATNVAGATFSDRDRSSAAGTSSATASGSGDNRSSSTLEAGTFADREGTDAFVAGSADAVARERTRPC